jgi:hypothetical protein
MKHIWGCKLKKFEKLWVRKKHLGTARHFCEPYVVDSYGDVREKGVILMKQFYKLSRNVFQQKLRNLCVNRPKLKSGTTHLCRLILNYQLQYMKLV